MKMMLPLLSAVILVVAHTCIAYNPTNNLRVILELLDRQNVSLPKNHGKGMLSLPTRPKRCQGNSQGRFFCEAEETLKHKFRNVLHEVRRNLAVYNNIKFECNKQPSRNSTGEETKLGEFVSDLRNCIRYHITRSSSTNATSASEDRLTRS